MVIIKPNEHPQMPVARGGALGGRADQAATEEIEMTDTHADEFAPHDIVFRLRTRANESRRHYPNWPSASLENHAANEIERLRAECARLRQAVADLSPEGERSHGRGRRSSGPCPCGWGTGPNTCSCWGQPR